MAGEIPTGHGSVFHFLDIFALGFGLAAVESLVSGKSLWIVGACVLAAIAIHILGTKWPSIQKRLGPHPALILHRLAVWISVLLVGYLMLNIVLYVYQLRSDLDAYVMPRNITEDQANQISQSLMGKDQNIPVYIYANSADGEAVEYAAQLSDAIKKGGWETRFGALNPWETGPTAVRNNGTFYNIYLALDQGVSLRVGFAGEPHNPDPKHPSPGDILAEAFHKAGINVGSGGAWNKEQYSLIVEVGRRPKTIIVPTIRSQVGQWIMRHWIMVPR